MFYKFLYDFFISLRTNICEFSPQGLSQKKILEYSLMKYIASYVVNSRSEYSSNDQDKSEEISKFTLAKHFVKRYFDKKGSDYKPSMQCANKELKEAVRKAGLTIGKSLSELGKTLDTKHQPEDGQHKAAGRIQDGPSEVGVSPGLLRGHGHPTHLWDWKSFFI